MIVNAGLLIAANLVADLFYRAVGSRVSYAGT